MLERYTRHEPAWSAGSALGRLVSHLRVPLYGGAYALIVSSSATSVLGIAYWTLAARLCGAAEVGVNAAAISAMVFLSYLAQLNLAGALTRFVPTAGRTTSRLVIAAYGIAAIVSGTAGIVFVLGIGIWAPNVRPVVGNAVLSAWFVFAVMAWSLFALQDAVLTGLRRTVWVPIENTIYALGKILLLVAIARSAADVGLFVSWTIPAAIAILPVNWLIFRRFIGPHAERSGDRPPEATPRLIARYLSGDYLGSLSMAAATGLLPLIILSTVGARGSAYFYMAWTIAYSMQLISVNSALSLTVEGAARQSDVVHSVRRILWLLVRIQVPLVLGIVVFAPLILQLFGQAYADEASTLLRLFALGVLPHAINSVFLSLARIRREIRWLFTVQATQALLLVVLSLLFLQPMGITGVGVAFLIAQSLVAAVLIVTRLRPLLMPDSHSPHAERAFDSAASGPVAGATALGSTADLPAAAGAGLLQDRALGELSRAGVRWALLRPPRAAEAGDDVDVLVAPANYAMARTVLRGLGFLELPGRGRGSHRFFLGHDPSLGEWLALDLVTGLAFGRRFEFETNLGAACLAQLSGPPTSRRLDPDDELYALLLHCLLDKGFVSPGRAGQLEQLATAERAPGSARQLVASLLPSGWTTDRIEEALRAGDWARLESLREPLGRGLRRRDPVGTRRRSAVRALVRRVEPLLLVRRPGMTVALVGPDGAGKSTMARRLASSYGMPVRCVYMGLWRQGSSRWRRTRGAIEIATRPARIWCRYLIAVGHRRLGRIVVFDRYSFDAVLPPKGGLVGLKRAYFWLLARCAPAPDMLIILDAPGEILFARKGESDPAGLELERRHFRGLTGRVKNAVIVDVSAEEDDVFGRVDALMWRHLLENAQGSSTLGSRPPAGLAERSAAVVRSSAGLAVRRVGNLKRRVQARPAIDLALSDLQAQSFIPESWRAGRLSVTETGIGLVRLGPRDGPAQLMLKLPLSPSSDGALQTHVQVVRRLAADARLAGSSSLLPVIRGHGRAGELRYVVEDLLPGRPASSALKSGNGGAVLRAAALAIAEIHRQTGEQLHVDEAIVDAWVWGPVRSVRAALPASAGSSWRADALEGIAGFVAPALNGRDIRVAWVHGDYWPGNVLVSEDGSRVTGIVDWDLAGPQLPPLHDAIDLILFARRIQQHRDVGLLARAMLEDPHLDEAEDYVMRTVGLGWPADGPGIRLAIMLAWLRHVGSVAGASGHAHNPWWVRQNLDPFLRSPSPSLQA
jgi:O-antigen/teichoic acid export membrane protein/thymidylate kinase